MSEFEHNRLVRESNRRRRAMLQKQKRREIIESTIDVLLFIVFLWILCFWAGM